MTHISQYLLSAFVFLVLGNIFILFVAPKIHSPGHVNFVLVERRRRYYEPEPEEPAEIPWRTIVTFSLIGVMNVIHYWWPWLSLWMAIGILTVAAGFAVWAIWTWFDTWSQK